MAEATHFTCPTPFGPAALAFDTFGALTRLTLIRDGAPAAEVDGTALPEYARAAAVQLQEYFARERREFDLPLQPQGTPFQLAVWDELTRIPYGATITYAELARRVDAKLGATAAEAAGLDPAGQPGGSLRIRAVGRANGQNPIWIVIPCHRVVGADGALTGYAGGIEVKRALLELEGARTARLFG